MVRADLVTYFADLFNVDGEHGLAQYFAHLYTKPDSFASPYEAGKNCAIHGADMKNCDYRWFRTRELAAEWQRGYDELTPRKGDG